MAGSVRPARTLRRTVSRASCKGQRRHLSIIALPDWSPAGGGPSNGGHKDYQHCHLHPASGEEKVRGVSAKAATARTGAQFIFRAIRRPGRNNVASQTVVCGVISTPPANTAHNATSEVRARSGSRTGAQPARPRAGSRESGNRTVLAGSPCWRRRDWRANRPGPRGT